MPTDYFINRNGTVKIFVGLADNIRNFFLKKTDDSEYFNLITLELNEANLVKFPDRMNFFDRYGVVDTGGKNNQVVHGKGDHYLLPDVAAHLFGLAAVLKDSYGIHISFGDMSADNGTDPWSKGFADHSGHGHGSRKGIDIDFRYINHAGHRFHGYMNDKQFSVEKNQLVYRIAELFGFRVNYQGKMSKLSGIPTAGGHDDHGHLGFGSHR